MVSFVYSVRDLLKRRFFLILWISLVALLFYDTFGVYSAGPQFHHLRQMLGLGLCVSRGSASVLSASCALLLLPQCKAAGPLLARLLCPRLFFFWLENAKSFHITVAVTLVLFSVIHSISHFVNLWNFSRGYDEATKEANMATYKNENPVLLLLSLPGLTGLAMLAVVLSMGLTSMRVVRRRLYNAFWYTHQLYFVFLVLFVVHPLRGVLKEEVLADNESSPEFSQIGNWNNITAHSTKFVAIKSRNWAYMAVPFSCFAVDLIWRIFSRNRSRVRILRVRHMAGRTLSLALSCARAHAWRPGQFVLLQCRDVSALEWHPFTVAKLPTPAQLEIVVWIRVKGDWTEALEKLLIERGPSTLSMLVDGPFCSALQGASAARAALCVAAGVGVTPFAALLQRVLRYPRSRYPGRIHLVWIVRHDEEVTWLAKLATDLITQLRNNNRPDRFNLQLYITNTNANKETSTQQTNNTHVVVVNEKGTGNYVIKPHPDEETATLHTPKLNRIPSKKDNCLPLKNNDYNISKEYPILGCRVRRGRPNWDEVFGYWVHLYPGQHLNLYCCGPKKLVKLLKLKCNQASNMTKTSFTFIHEGFA